MAMTITLTSDQQAWLEAEVRTGRLTSVEDAVRTAIAGMMAVENDDLSWAKPKVDAARASIVDGNVVDGPAFMSRLDVLIASLETR